MSGIVTNDAKQMQRDFYTKYKVGQPIGEGAYGVVYLASNLSTGEFVAVKCIERVCLKYEDIVALREEVRIMLSFNHPYAIQLHEIYDDDPEYFFMVMEYAAGGELFDRIVQKSCYTENDSRIVIVQIASCLTAMNLKGIVYRDLKPENLVYTTHEADDAVLKVIDFGFSKILSTHKVLDI